MLTDRRKLPRIEGVVFSPSFPCNKYFQENRAPFPPPPAVGAVAAPCQSGAVQLLCSWGLRAQPKAAPAWGRSFLCFTQPWCWGEASELLPSLLPPTSSSPSWGANASLAESCKPDPQHQPEMLTWPAARTWGSQGAHALEHKSAAGEMTCFSPSFDLNNLIFLKYCRSNCNICFQQLHFSHSAQRK